MVKRKPYDARTLLSVSRKLWNEAQELRSLAGPSDSDYLRARATELENWSREFRRDARAIERKKPPPSSYLVRGLRKADR
jgi:hypothetical protein